MLNGILLKIPLFQNQILRGCFNQAPQQHHFCTVISLSMLQKSLGYAINNFGRFYRVPEKIVIFKKIKITLQFKFGFLPYSLVKYITCLLDRG